MAVGELVTRSGFSLAAKIKSGVGGFLSTGAHTGTFQYGETVTGGTSSATGVVVYASSTDQEVLVAAVTGTFQNAETVTGGTSSATATTDAAPATDWGTSWTTVTRVRDNFQVNRNRPVQEIVDFDSDETEFTDKVAGNQSANSAFTQNLVPGGVSFQLFEASMDYNLDLGLRRILTNRDGDATRTRYYIGISTGFNEQDSVTDASTVATQVELSDVSLTDPT